MIKLAKNPGLTKYFQEQIQQCSQMRHKFYEVLTEQQDGADLLTRLAYDCTGNFIIQKLIDTHFVEAIHLVELIENITPSLALNRYGCRVIQKLVQVAPSYRVERLLSTHFIGQEFQLITDQNANRIVQRLIADFEPDVYLPFLRSLINAAGLKPVLENKYGCRVMQSALERAVQLCTANQQQQSNTKRSAYALLHLLIPPILEDALDLCTHEFGNYIIQTIFKTDFLEQPRRYIIKNHLMHNILVLSQCKHSSHVLEVAFHYADNDSLNAMFLEVFESYEPDISGRTALHIMLFDQFGNYVVQRMLDIAIKVRLGQRQGKLVWFNCIADYVISVRHQLARYSSGAKILETVSAHMGATQIRQPLFASGSGNKRMSQHYAAAAVPISSYH